MDITKVKEIVAETLAGTDMFLVECQAGADNDITIIIDSDTRVTIDACAELNRAIDAAFDREVEDFSLTVCSAGIGEPLKTLRQYQKLVGSSVEVLLVSGTKLTGTLDQATAENITISYEEKVAIEGRKRKELQRVAHTFAYDEVKWTKEHLDYK